MTLPDPTDELLEAMPLPRGALPVQPGASSSREWAVQMRELAVAHLQQAMAEQAVDLTLGPTTALDDPDRLLLLNRFAIQLVCGGIDSDAVQVPLAPWRSATTAPQLLLVACIDAENDAVQVPGVLSGQEFIALAQKGPAESENFALDPALPRGGIERLFFLVELLEPEALPRQALAPASTSAGERAVVAVWRWAQGQVDDALEALGAELVPSPQAGFRSGDLGIGAIAAGFAFQAPGAGPTRPPLLRILLGLAGDQLVSGAEAEACIERFQLLLQPLGTDKKPKGLRVRLEGVLEGDLLPDGLALELQQGSEAQSLRAKLSAALELSATSLQPVELRVTYPGSAPVVLPALQLGGP